MWESSICEAGVRPLRPWLIPHSPALRFLFSTTRKAGARFSRAGVENFIHA